MLRSLIQNSVPRKKRTTIQVRRHEQPRVFVRDQIQSAPKELAEALVALLPGESLTLFRVELEDDLPSPFARGQAWYVHARANDGPAGPATIAVGGDCIRPDPHDLEDVIRRVGQLSTAMVSKAASTLPDLPSLHGGKKGEFIFFDATGDKIEVIGQERESTAAALCARVLAFALPWLNARQAERMPTGFPLRIPVETGSPDVFTGPWWTTIHREAATLGLDRLLLTCPPVDDGGLAPSSLPTAHGVLAAFREVLRSLDIEPAKVRVLHEGAGGVASYFLPLMLDLGVQASNVLVLDRSATALQENAKSFRARVGVAASTYGDLGDERFDLLVVNGDGDQLDHASAEGIQRAGIRAVLGAANNILKVRSENEVARWLLDHGVEVIPDPIVSPGGWTYAVVLQILRASGQAASPHHLTKINQFVERKVASLVAETLREPGAWTRGHAVISERRNRSQSTRLEGEELHSALDPVALLSVAAIL